MANDKKELDMEMLNKIAGGEFAAIVDPGGVDLTNSRSNAYAQEMAEKYGVDLQAEGLTGVLIRMTEAERDHFLSLLTKI